VLRGKRHPSDDALVRWYMADHGFEALAADDEGIVRHVSDCARCAARYEALCLDLTGAARVSVEGADAAFPAERLVAQREHILRRIDTQGARVLPFPAADLGARRAASARPLLRWVAVAAAAGLVVGLTAGRILHLTGDSAPASPVQASVTPRPMAPPGPTAGPRTATVANTSGEDAFLWDVESAITDPRTPALEAIDAMTLRGGPPPPLR
jgi:hypothetical protein